MVEAVRLVIWDLDETFWKGTLSEGGITYLQSTHDCVVALARRGITSSICSNNDFETVKAILVERDIWDYFIFPNISWGPKGQRVHSIIDQAQLRPPSVIFIDDNPMNLNEARHYTPGLQVADENIISTLLENPLFRGKDDAELSRLKQYKLLERRKSDETASGCDNAAFLRKSGIKVEVIHDVEAHLDRAIELINRTNQLNFTKRRLPDDRTQARAELRRQIESHSVQAALVWVTDNYGDYGICGYFATQTRPGGIFLLDFCFSCRIANMGVETWLFEQIGRPPVHVVGDVITDLFAATEPVNWINRPDQITAEIEINARPLGLTVLHGGCDLMPLELYFRPYAEKVIGEFNTFRDHVEIRTDHSANLRLAISRPNDAILTAVERLGYTRDDMTTVLGNDAIKPSVVVLSFGVDAEIATYRHKELQFRAPILLPIQYPAGPGMNVVELDPATFADATRSAWITDVIGNLRQNYVYEGASSEATFKSNVRIALDAIPSSARIFVVGLNEYRRADSPGEQFLVHNAKLNSWMRDTIAGHRNAEFVSIRDFVQDELEINTDHPGHFSRMVYFRMSQHIVRRMEDIRSRPEA